MIPPSAPRDAVRMRVYDRASGGAMKTRLALLLGIFLVGGARCAAPSPNAHARPQSRSAAAVSSARDGALTACTIAGSGEPAGRHSGAEFFVYASPSLDDPVAEIRTPSSV